MAASPLTQLAEELLKNAKALDAYNQQHKLPPVGFEHESFVDLPLEIEVQRKAVIDLAQDVKRLAQGPRDQLFELCNHFNDLANIEYIYHHKLAQAVPLEGSVSYTELAKATGLDAIFVRRIVRVGMMNRVFIETPDGRVTHSAMSRILHEEPGAMDAAGFLLQEMFPAAAKMVEATTKYPSSGEPNETPFNVAFNTSRPFYLELETVPERARRFGSAMRWMSQGGRYSNEHLIRGYDWTGVDAAGGTVVDVGGGHGAVASALARATSRMRFVVQDLPISASQGAKLLPAELAGRVSFMAHDFFAPQPVKGADVYFFRYILHNWSDKYAEQILRATVPAMRHGSRVLCVEFLPGDRSNTRWSDKQAYNMDMLQAIGWNSIERTASDWERLFTSTDKRLKFLGTRTPPGCSVSLIEASFEDPTAVNGAGVQ